MFERLFDRARPRGFRFVIDRDRLADLTALAAATAIIILALPFALLLFLIALAILGVLAAHQGQAWLYRRLAAGQALAWAALAAIALLLSASDAFAQSAAGIASTAGNLFDLACANSPIVKQIIAYAATYLAGSTLLVLAVKFVNRYLGIVPAPVVAFLEHAALDKLSAWLSTLPPAPPAAKS
jgi:hypothetical protein